MTASTSSYNGGEDTTYAQGTPIGLGVRVPMLVVSPFSQGGWVCSDVFDHTSQLQFIEEIFPQIGSYGGASVDGNVSAWRLGTVGNLTSALPTGPTVGKNNKLQWPKKPVLSVKTSDSIKESPIEGECLPGDLIEVGRSTLTVEDCKTTSGSNVVSSTNSFTSTGVFVGQAVVGTGIPNGTTVSAVKSTRITLSNAATASGTVTLSFPEPYTPYPIPSPQTQPTPVYPSPPLNPTPS